MADQPSAQGLPQPVQNAPTSISGPSEASDAAPLLPGNGSEQTQTSSPREQQTFQERAYAFFSRRFWRSSQAVEDTEAQNSNSSAASDTTRARRGNSGVAGAAANVPVLAERSGSNVSALDIESASTEIQSSPSDPARSTSTTPVCLICLENLAPEDFAAGRAISLGCNCRGDLALRHKDCAQKWAQVKDNGQGGVPVCELCKHPAKNLPAIPPRPHLLRPDPAAPPTPGLPDELYADQMAFATFAPSMADLVFDCIRVSWVAMIVSILFFEASLGAALWTGAMAGMAYAVMVRVMYRSHFEAMRAYAEQQQAAAAAARGQGPPQIAVNVV